MKKLFLFLMLSASIGQSLFAQQQSINYGEEWNQAIEIKLKNNAKVYVVSNVTPLLLDAGKYNLDSIMKVVLLKYKEIEEETDELTSKTVTYHYGLNDKNGKYNLGNTKEGFTVKTHQANEKRYGIVDGTEFVKLKTLKDTLIINLIFGELPEAYKEKVKIKNTPRIGYQMSYGFIVNNISDLENIDYKEVRLEIAKNIYEIRAKVGLENMLKKPMMPINTTATMGTANKSFDWTYQVSNIVAFTNHFSGGWIRDKFAPEFGADVLFLTKGKFGFGLTVNQFYHFNNLPDNSFKVSESTFVGFQGSFFDRNLRKKFNGNEKFTQTGNFSFGYLVNKSDYFPKNTWRTSVAFPVTKHLSVEPEFYFSPGNAPYPSIRFKVM
ncbi:MAG: hypothetical protein U5M51_00185 [Emticicia sp.]|nr:hypothetical protein [Emticicia sp.]